MSNNSNPREAILALVKTALAEDVGAGDITSQLLIPANAQASMRFVAREKMVVCGVDVPVCVYAELDRSISVSICAKDGDIVQKGDVIATVSGNARALLTGERVALNIMQRMSGVATLARQYADAMAGTKAKILDTRKTMPGMRLLDKYAVRMGGGQNHRMRLDDMILIKDNHIALMGSIANAVEHCRKESKLTIVVECDTLAQCKEALAAACDRILLDNMTLEDLRAAVKIAAGKIPLEASGGVNLQTVRGIAETGVDYISVGAITHSAVAVDIGLDTTTQ